MKSIDLSLVPKIRTARNGDGQVVYNFIDVQHCTSNRPRRQAENACYIGGRTHISFDDVVKFFEKSRKPNKDEAMRMFKEVYGNRETALREPQKRTMVDPNYVCINPTQSHDATAVARKDDCEQKIDDAWKSVMKACNDAKALAEACYKRGMEYKQMYYDEKQKVVRLAEAKMSDADNKEVQGRLRFLTVEYGRMQEERLLREYRKIASADANGLYTPTAIGDVMGISAHDVNVFLLGNKYQTRNTEQGDKQPKYKVAEDLGKDYAVSEYYEEDNGRKYYQLRWTTKGLHLILGTWAVMRMMQNNISI